MNLKRAYIKMTPPPKANIHVDFYVPLQGGGYKFHSKKLMFENETLFEMELESEDIAIATTEPNKFAIDKKGNRALYQEPGKIYAPAKDVQEARKRFNEVISKIKSNEKIKQA